MHEFRLIIDPPMNAAVNMARDRAILEMQSMKNPLPTLRIYRWSAPSVTLGYFQKFEDFVNTEFCRKNGISVTRRVTGGGAVLHHMELTYSFTIPVKKRIVPESVEDSFSVIIAPIIDAIKYFSIDAVYRPVNDIVINGKKISGSAQVRKKGVLQQHGTLLMDLNDELVCSALKSNYAKMKSRGFNKHSDAVTSLCRELRRGFTEDFTDEFIAKFVSCFRENFNANFSLAELSEAENAIMETYINKFNSSEWNYMR